MFNLAAILLFGSDRAILSACPGHFMDAAHLAWLRDQLGPSFLHGFVLCAGPRPRAIGERLTALPISAIWR